jgi:outer membrane protein assembly factor BamB
VPDLPTLPEGGQRASTWSESVGASKAPEALRPAYRDGFVYAAGLSGEVVKIAAATGQVQWRTDLGVPISAGVGVDGDRVVVGTRTGQIAALGTDGKALWQVPLASEPTSVPFVRDALVVVRTSDSRIVGLDARTGERRWMFQRSPPPLVLRSFTGFSAQGREIFAGMPGGKLAALVPANGAARWEVSVALPKGTNEIERITDVIGIPWAGDREVCAVSYQGRIGCFEQDRGSTLWTKPISSASGLDGDARYIYVSDDKGNVIALDRTDGTVAWRQEALRGRALSAPTALGREIAVGDMQGYVHFLARDTGQIVGRGRANGDPIDNPPVVIDGGVVVQTRSGGLSAFRLAP